MDSWPTGKCAIERATTQVRALPLFKAKQAKLRLVTLDPSDFMWGFPQSWGYPNSWMVRENPNLEIRMMTGGSPMT